MRRHRPATLSLQRPKILGVPVPLGARFDVGADEALRGSFVERRTRVGADTDLFRERLLVRARHEAREGDDEIGLRRRARRFAQSRSSITRSSQVR